MKIKQWIRTSLLTVAAMSLAAHAHAGSLLNNPSLAPSFNAIIGGSEVESGDPVASSAVLIVGKDGDSTFICSGSVLDKNLILTAAHCLGMDGLAKVVVAFRTKMDGQGTVAKVIDRRRPTDFLDRAGRSETDWNDLAIIKIQGEIPAGYEVAKVLPDVASLKDGSTVTLAGYGMTTPLSPPDGGDSGAGTLRKVEQTVLKSSYGDTEFTVSLKERGACHGDSGGPAYLRKDGQLYLIGVASRMTENDRVANNGDANDFSCSVDMVYTNVIKSSDWINKAVKELKGQ